jgi:hypothetical protein
MYLFVSLYCCSIRKAFMTALLQGVFYAVANVFDRGKGQASDQSPFLQTLLALKAGLQASALACEALYKDLQSATGMFSMLCVMKPACRPISHMHRCVVMC